jgi:hypothetical protein
MAAKTLPVPRTTAIASAIKSGVFMAKLATIRPRALSPFNGGAHERAVNVRGGTVNPSRAKEFLEVNQKRLTGERTEAGTERRRRRPAITNLFIAVTVAGSISQLQISRHRRPEGRQWNQIRPI